MRRPPRVRVQEVLASQTGQNGQDVLAWKMAHVARREGADAMKHMRDLLRALDVAMLVNRRNGVA